MKTYLPKPLLSALMLSATLVLFPLVAVAQDQSLDEQDDEGLARVARISFLEGDVSLLRSGETEWSPAELNLPLLEGDQVYVAGGARCEIQLGRGAFIRLTEKTALAIAVLSPAAVQFEVTEGTASIRIDHFAAAFDRFEVDTPGAALLLEKNGIYRVNVRADGESEVIVGRGAVDVTTADGNFKVQDGHRLTVGSTKGRLEIALDTSLDDWDRWTRDRDTTIDQVVAAGQTDYVTTYETDYNSFYGASELSHYGSWTNLDSYGHCWLPRMSYGWAPYRHGRWRWITGAGWSWISFEPWGWAPYHYGRWVYLDRLGWAWVPGFHSRFAGFGHFRWRPALVYFFNCPSPRGHYVGWYPLSPGERWRRPDRYARNNPAFRDRRPGRNGISLVPVSGFNGSRSRPQGPDRDLRPWLDRDPRPGLPEIPTSRPATWTAIAPPSEVISRPVVTRNVPKGSVSRERTLVTPQIPKTRVRAEGQFDGNSGQRSGQRLLDSGAGSETQNNNNQWRSPRLTQGEVITRDQEVAPGGGVDRGPTRELDGNSGQPRSSNRVTPKRELDSPEQPRDLGRPTPRRDTDSSGQPRDVEERPAPKREPDNGVGGSVRIKPVEPAAGSNDAGPKRDGNWRPHVQAPQPRDPSPADRPREKDSSVESNDSPRKQRGSSDQADETPRSSRSERVKTNEESDRGSRWHSSPEVVDKPRNDRPVTPKVEPRVERHSEPRPEKVERSRQPSENKEVRREERRSNEDGNQRRSRKS